MAIGIRLTDWPIITAAFRKLYEQSDELHAVCVADALHVLATQLAEGNRNFKPARFLHDCGLPGYDPEPLDKRTVKRLDSDA